jgi:hypothetical protein
MDDPRPLCRSHISDLRLVVVLEIPSGIKLLPAAVAGDIQCVLIREGRPGMLDEIL